MTEPRIFSPFERVATEIAGFLQRKSFQFSALTFQFDDLEGVYTYINNPDWENQGWNIDPEKSLCQRLLPEFSGSFTVVTELGDDGEAMTRRFKVFNCLRVSEPYVEAEPRWLNTTVGTRRYRAVESTDTLSQRQSETFDVNLTMDQVYDARPFDQYTLLARNVEENEYILLGPSCVSPISYLVGTQRFEDHDYEISVDEWFFKKYNLTVQQPEESSSYDPGDHRPHFVVRYGVMSEEWFPGCTFTSFNGSRWHGGDLLLLIRYAMLVEMNNISKAIVPLEIPGYDLHSDTYYIDVDVIAGICYLPVEIVNFVRKYAAANAKIDDFLDRFSATEKSFTLSDANGKTSLIGTTGKPNLSFVWSFSYLLGHGTPSNTIVAMKACLDAQLFKIESGKLVGDTANQLSSEKSLSYNDISGATSYQLKRVTLDHDFEKITDGFVLLGWDDAALDDKDTNPTHWIVARKMGSEFFNVYDPFNFEGAGLTKVSVTRNLKMQDAQIVLLKGADEWAWMNS